MVIVASGRASFASFSQDTVDALPCAAKAIAPCSKVHNPNQAAPRHGVPRLNRDDRGPDAVLMITPHRCIDGQSYRPQTPCPIDYLHWDINWSQSCILTPPFKAGLD
jgi:hypothetical protein